MTLQQTTAIIKKKKFIVRSISPVTRPSTQDAFGTNFVTRINSPEGARHEGDEETGHGHGHEDTEAALRRHQAGIMMRWG